MEIQHGKQQAVNLYVFEAWATTSNTAGLLQQQATKPLIGRRQGQLRPELQNHPEVKKSTLPTAAPATTAAPSFLATPWTRKTIPWAKTTFRNVWSGRISFNHAVEVPRRQRRSEAICRFVGQPITLKVLGQLHASSAVELYLKQGKLPGQLTTHGDLPADPGVTWLVASITATSLMHAKK